ncbi:potassium channel family protein [Sphingomonas sp. R647]|uniref:potassium channel family protein n=1 Tax=Sphingomonas sp. R647 TaxID=2875233 RepID=UPI001CD50F15|nr:potassium channel family protein [Sphingomonas sp. R647]MCA1196613.1 potassium channel family protein [Sphingomonas sp. R647]
MSRKSTPTHAALRRKSSLSPWVSIAWRVGAVLGLYAFAVAFHWFDREGLRDNFDQHISFLDIIYFTMISITTTGYGDIVPISTGARMFDALVVTPIRIFVILIFIGTTYQFILKRTWDRWRMAQIQKMLTNHIVVAGYGKTGSDAVNELVARGIDPACIVVIDGSEHALSRAEEAGCNVLVGDATRDQTLQDVRIGEAKTLIVATGRDDTSILVTLTARHLAPKVPISIIIKADDNEFPARAAGANTVINPVSFAGLLLAGSVEGMHVADYMLDLASVDGRVHLSERCVAAHEIGKPLSAIATGLGVRIYRDGVPHGFFEPEAHALRENDVIVEIIPTGAVASS